MNERRKLHPVYILFGLLQTIQGFLPVILIALFKGVEWSELRWYWFVGVAAAIVGILIFSYLGWKRFGFWLEEDRIIIRRGLLFRDEKTIYFTRIHSVNVEQPLIQRLLGVAQVKIETPGGNKKADGILPALSLLEANRIQRILKGQADAKVPLESKPEPSSEQVKEPVPSAVLHDADATHPLTSDSGQISFRLDTAQLLKAAATSMNFGLVAAFIAGLYSLANDFIEQLLPDHFFESFVEDSVSLMPGVVFIVIVIIIGLGFAWLLSVLLYILKYNGFTARRDGKQITVSYGLLEKRTHVFDPKKVQAVIIKEGIFRQMLGYAQIQLQVISSNKNEQLMLHPFLPVAELERVIGDFIPRMKLMQVSAAAPERALIYYLRNELIMTAVACAVVIGFFKLDGLWSLLLLPLIIIWRWFCFKAAGIKLDSGQLTLRGRNLARVTYLIRRPQIVTMKVKRTRGQQRKRLVSLSVHAMGSVMDYSVACLDEKDIEPVWNWYSGSRK